MATEFKVDDLVKIIFSTWNKDGVEGEYGRIVSVGDLIYDWKVRVAFPGARPEILGFNADELELLDSEDESGYFDIA